MKTMLMIGLLMAGAWVGTANAQCIINAPTSPQRSTAYRPVSAHRYVHAQPAPRGYWKLQCKQVYVPGHWVQGFTPCGTLTKQWVPGGYQTVSQYVWVPSHAKPACGSTVVIARR